MNRLWIAFATVLVSSFLVLGWIGSRIYQQMPPMPDKVLTSDGELLIDSREIEQGQNVWQSMGGMEVGSIWGHGSYVAPDWTADWLHREAVYILKHWSQKEFETSFDQLSEEQQSQLQGRLTALVRKNSFNFDTKTITITPLRAADFESNLAHPIT